MKDIVVYHGSRGGLFGDIRPISRSRCDFGVGFYMGDNKAQAKGLIVETENPTLYTLRLRLSEIPEDRILLLNGKEWLNTVLACRQRIKDFSKLGIAKEALQRLDRYDIVIGAIADDRMNEAMTRFSEYALTNLAEKSPTSIGGEMNRLQVLLEIQPIVCYTMFSGSNAKGGVLL